MLATLLLLLPLAAEPRLELVSVQKIWDQAPHNAFGDIIRFQNKFYAVFREAKQHVADKKVPFDDGKLRVISSDDGDQWNSAALIAEEGTDLRDPHFSITDDKRLMIVAGGSIYRDAVFGGRQPRVMFSTDGTHWTSPRKVLLEGHWLWRVTWQGGRAYGVSKIGDGTEGNPRRTFLMRSNDGLEWTTVTEFAVPGSDETTVRFLPDGRMLALSRCTLGDETRASIGISKSPYRQWQWTKTDAFIGGPNFLPIPKGPIVAGGRHFRGGYRKDPVTAIGILTPERYERQLELPSGGDSSYPGFVWHANLLWTLYYSSHEGKACIYLARIRIQP